MNYRLLLIKIATFVGGLYFFLNFVLPKAWFAGPLEGYDERIKLSFTVVGAMGFALGLINIFLVHGSKIAFLRKGWVNSAALILGFLCMATVTYLDWRENDRIARSVAPYATYRDFVDQIQKDRESKRTDVPALPFRVERLVDAIAEEVPKLHEVHRQLSSESGIPQEHQDHALLKSSLADLAAAVARLEEASAQVSQAVRGAEDALVSSLNIVKAPLQEVSAAYRSVLTISYRHSGVGNTYKLLFQGLTIPLGAAMFALLGFYIATAAFRAFRIRSAESGLMLFAALLVMLGQIPFGLWIWDGLPAVRNWLLTVPSGGARLAIEIGVSIAGLIMAFRMWLSIESESFSKGSK